MSAPATIPHDAPFHLMVCGEPGCGVRFYIPDHVHEQALTLGPKAGWSCPNGHRYHWTESEEDRLLVQLEQRDESIGRLHELLAEANTRNNELRRSVAYWKGIAHRRRKP